MAPAPAAIVAPDTPSSKPAPTTETTRGGGCPAPLSHSGGAPRRTSDRPVGTGTSSSGDSSSGSGDSPTADTRRVCRDYDRFVLPVYFQPDPRPPARPPPAAPWRCPPSAEPTG